MIRLVHPRITREIEFRENEIKSLVIESPDFFSELTSDLLSQSCGCDGTAVLSSDYSPIAFSKRAELISGFLPFDSNRKALIGKIAGEIEKAAVNESNIEKTQRLISDMENYFYDITFDFSCELVYTKLSVANIVKLFGIQIADSGNGLTDRILDYMELVREFEGEKVFVFVNLRSYVSDKTMSSFADTVISRKHFVLLIDSIDRERIKGEDRITIDNDLCEI